MSVLRSLESRHDQSVFDLRGVTLREFFGRERLPQDAFAYGADTTCSACVEGEVDPSCFEAFGSLGIRKVHWESWGNCNLACPKCFMKEFREADGDPLFAEVQHQDRTQPLGTVASMRMIASLSGAGVGAVAFAGGDPSLRRDIHVLVEFAKFLNLETDFHTNGHYTPDHVMKAMLLADSVKFSLDGSNAATHDAIRLTRDNFDRVMSWLEILSNLGKTNVGVRTVVSAESPGEAERLAPIIAQFPCIRQYEILEFVPLEGGAAVRDSHELVNGEFLKLGRAAKEAFDVAAQKSGLATRARLFPASDSPGAYLILTPDGYAYGTGSPDADGNHAVVGHILSSHHADLADALPFEANRHQRFGHSQVLSSHSTLEGAPSGGQFWS